MRGFFGRTPMDYRANPPFAPLTPKFYPRTGVKDGRLYKESLISLFSDEFWGKSAVQWDEASPAWRDCGL
jgi:hypothetical protein